jgi:hypothetical protein
LTDIGQVAAWDLGVSLCLAYLSLHHKLQEWLSFLLKNREPLDDVLKREYW